MMLPDQIYRVKALLARRLSYHLAFNRGSLYRRLWHQGNQFLKTPNMVGQSRFHCWRHPERLVNSVI